MKSYRKDFKNYLNDLGKAKPAPGGGSAVCLIFCTGLSLIAKAINYSRRFMITRISWLHFWIPISILSGLTALMLKQTNVNLRFLLVKIILIFNQTKKMSN